MTPTCAAEKRCRPWPRNGPKPAVPADVLAETGAERGFVVVREHGSFEQRFDVRFGSDETSDAERRFSRGLVRQAIETGRTVHSADLADDPRFADGESARLIGSRS